jgi:hypothetical protein
MDRRSNRFNNFSTKIGVVKIGNRSRSIWHEGLPDEIV